MEQTNTVFKVIKYCKSSVLLFSLLILSFNSFGQTLKIKGKVISEDDKMELPGVNVRILGTNQGTITDFRGNYELMAESGETLEFSFIGMETQTVKLSTQTVIDVVLKTDVQLLDEVVAIGYGEQKKKEVSGAVAHVSNESFSNFVTGDVSNALQGQIAGVNVSTSGSPGADAVIQIRGVSTVSDMAGATEPLYVVDGIPQNENPRLAPSEIQSMDILKDLASCAIYGTRGANGVILITTKKGQEGKLSVSIDGSFGVKNIVSGIDLMNTQQQVYFDQVKERNRGANDWDNSTNLPIPRNPAFFSNDTNLSDVVILDNQPTQSYNLGVNGGSKGLTYNVTAGYYDDQGSLINSGFSRFNGRAGMNYKKDKWHISSSIGITSENLARTSSNLLTQTIRYAPYKPVLDLTSDIIVDESGWNTTNNVLEAMRQLDETKRERAQANLSLGYEIIEGLKIQSNIGLNSVNEFRVRFKPFIENYDENGILQSDPANSYINNESIRRTSFSIDGRLSYVKKFGKHKISGILGVSNESHSRESFFAERTGIVDNSIRVLNGAALAASATSGYNYTYNIIGTLGRITYDYDSRYMFSVSGNYNGNSKFAEGKKWKFFPSASAAWNIAEEEFWESFSRVNNNFKIRASHGQVGGQSFLPYTDKATIQNGMDYPFGSGGFPTLYFGAAQQSFANGNVQWETSIQNNIGIDLGFMGNKFILNADLYHTQKSDMLFPVQLPPSGGAGTGADSKMTMNIGNMVNKGLELAGTFKGKTGGVNWTVTGTFTKNINEITSLNTEEFIYTTDNGLISGASSTSKITAFSQGYEAGAFFLYKTDGVVKSDEQLREYQKIKPDARLGDLIYLDTDGDGQITDADRVYMGSGFSDFETGLILNLTWKNFDFMMHWYAAIGHSVMNGSMAMAYSEGRHADQVNTWNRANPNSDVPAYRGTTKEHDNFRGYTDLWLEDGSYLRLKNIQIGYTLPQTVLKKLGMANCRLFVSAQNPLTITNYTGYDPEAAGNGVSSRGLDKGNYPISALYLTGFKLNF
ncbi:SusC/RagA family TonB-linked outer membrane protein [Flammeovirga yaeyamensis]|uniref:SusC/RagA family TonB-linked outer membrane protein n=1 Tax=Flammeovirga yaeyamensis TaxID=367791 RepID=A0AAX1NDQ8_9BACT|nr:TonB-dependent receptor [Flammeovirga yaeyamensis]MBB3696614.1 TonB-linked SusC/RagA family outer membrane protein [Flammeovirga yaeyamensis]NMF33289.1 TonB-dependent receptor [Flammeovirga yaeyamensis]QWG05432.1 SusC/RagA family TonB-linked outer membrane protein [Flammeovirga yaeyamensis]